MNQKTKFKQTEIGNIPEDWEVKSIDEIKSKNKYAIAMGPFGSNITKDNFVESGVPVIRGNNFTEDNFFDEGFVFLTEDKANELKASNVHRGDIIITHRGTLGQVAIIPNNSKYQRYIVSQSGMKLTCNKDIVEEKFVFYYLKSKTGQYELLKNKNQTGVPSIAQPTSSLKSIIVPIPLLSEQHLIAKILSDLDYKIEFNNKMNKTLETIGHALFKKWFIEERKEDWKEGKLKDLVKLKMGISPKGESYNENKEGFPLLNGAADFSGKLIFAKKFTTSPIKICKKGDLIFCIRATIGNLTFANEEYCLGRGVAALEIEKDYREFVYYHVLNSLNGMISGAHGSVIRGLSKMDIEELRTIIPERKLVNQFNNLMNPIFEYQTKLDSENKNLVLIRDSLLPKLMSGEIRTI